MELLEQTVNRIIPPSEIWREKARQYILTLTMPPWALGRLLDLAVDLAGIQETLQPETRRKNIILMAGDHGIVEEGVSPSPKEVTCQMISNFLSGDAGVSVLSRQAGAGVTVVDIGDVYAIPTVLFCLYTTRKRHGLGLNLAIGRERSNRFNAFVCRHDLGEGTVSVIFELLNCNTTTESTTLR